MLNYDYWLRGQWNLFRNAVSRIHKWMRQNLFKRITFTRVYYQYLPDQIFSSLVSEVLGEVELSLYYSFVGFIDFIGFKWSLPN